MTTNLLTIPKVCPHCGLPPQLPEVFGISIQGKEFQQVAQGRIPGRWIRNHNIGNGEIDTVRTMPIPLLVVEEK